MMFRKAERKKAKLRLAFCGPSGSGKTYSALQMAKGLGGKIAFIDTERGSGEMYDHLCAFDICMIDAPFEVEKYIKAIHFAENNGFDTIIIDSLSHAWAAEGGLLDKVDKASSASRSGNSFAAWRNVTPLHNALVDAMLQSPCHIIATMRAKTSYEIQDNNGKKTPVKVGLAPVQREGMDYEFTVVFDVSLERHLASVSKDRTGLFDNQIILITPETGQQVKAWLDGGVDAPAPKPAAPAASERNPRGPSENLRRAFFAVVKKHAGNRPKEAIYEAFSKILGRDITSSSQLIPEEMSYFIDNAEVIREHLPNQEETPPPLSEKDLLLSECRELCAARELNMDQLLIVEFPSKTPNMLTVENLKKFRDSLLV